MCESNFSEMSENGNEVSGVTSAVNLSPGNSREIFPEVEPYL